MKILCDKVFNAGSPYAYPCEEPARFYYLISGRRPAARCKTHVLSPQAMGRVGRIMLRITKNEYLVRNVIDS